MPTTWLSLKLPCRSIRQCWFLLHRMVLRSSTVNLSVSLTKREQALSDAQLSVDGNDIDTKVSTDGDNITITGTVTGASGSHTAKVSFNGTSEWSFKVPALYYKVQQRVLQLV